VTSSWLLAKPFNDGNSLGWVLVANQTAKIALEQMVAVEAHTACLWSINLSRIIEILDNSTRFGFMYATTALHVEGRAGALCHRL
jgi:hypothetical protein